MPIPVISTDDLRRRLAGLVDPERTPGASEEMEYKEAAHRLGCVLASLFGESLDRLTLWDRIGSGFATACAKVDDGDLDRFASICLDHVKADPGAAASNAALGALLSTFAARPIEWRQGFVRYIRSHSYSVLVHARSRWERVKSKEIEL